MGNSVTFPVPQTNHVSMPPGPTVTQNSQLLPKTTANAYCVYPRWKGKI